MELISQALTRYLRENLLL